MTRVRGRVLRLVVVTAAGLSIGLAAPARAAESAPEAAKLFDRLSHNFGVVARGVSLRAAFTLRNRTATTYRISTVETSCGCTVVQPTNRTLKPGASSRIDAVFNTAGYSGGQEKSFLVCFDAPTSQYVTVVLRADCRPELTVTPGTTDFGSMPPGYASSRPVHVNYSGKLDFHVLKAKSGKPFVTAAFKEWYRQAGSVGYEVTVKVADAPLGPWLVPVDLTTDDPRMPRVRLWVKGKSKGRVQADPKAVFFGFLKTGQSSSRQVKVAGPKPFRILSVTGGGDLFRVTVDPTRSAREHVAPIQFTAGVQKGNVSRTLVFKTDLPERLQTTLTVYAHVE